MKGCKIDGNKKKTLFFDLVLILSLLVIGLSVFLVVRLTSGDGSYALVTVNGDEVGRYSLSDDGSYVLNGGTNVLVIENGKAYMKEAKCPDHTCVRTGKVSRDGESITCLPNRVRVEIVGGDGI